MASKSTVLYPEDAVNKAVVELQNYIEMLNKRYQTLLVNSKDKFGSQSELTRIIEATSITVTAEIISINGLIYDLQASVTNVLKPRNITGILSTLEGRVESKAKEEASVVNTLDTSPTQDIPQTQVPKSAQVTKLTPLKPIEEQSDEELEELKKMLTGKYKKLVEMVEKQTASRKAVLKASIERLWQWVNDECNTISRMINSRQAAKYYFTTGEGRDGGANAMLDSLMKSLDYVE
jgi:hypothetical protein